jgi:electron transport complex protein RnfB
MSATRRISIETLEDLLPQTQCRQCGYEGCTPYAQALLDGAAINLCVPGGDPVARQLASVLDTAFLPVANAPAHAPWRGTVARILEDDCIGCTKCIAACPVDAIIGAQKLMHTVITEDCTGCELCIPPCPTDCIVMEPVAIDTRRSRAERARQRHDARERRLSRAQHSAVSTFLPAVTQYSAAEIKRLETAALSARKRWKEAAAALRVAEKARRPDLTTLRERVTQLDARATEAETLWKNARGDARDTPP